jgi:hypothetical protein
MDRQEGPLTALTIALNKGLYLAIIMDRHEGPLTALTKALNKRPLHRNYNKPS